MSRPLLDPIESQWQNDQAERDRLTAEHRGPSPLSQTWADRALYVITALAVWVVTLVGAYELGLSKVTG